MTGSTEMLVAAIGPAITCMLAGVFVGSSWLLVQVGAPPAGDRGQPSGSRQ